MEDLRTGIQPHSSKPYGLPKSNNEETLVMVKEPEKADGIGDIDSDMKMEFPHGLPKSNNKKWAAMMECSLGEEMDVKGDSMLQLRAALPEGGEVVGPIALSSFESVDSSSEFGVRREGRCCKDPWQCSTGREKDNRRMKLIKLSFLKTFKDRVLRCLPLASAKPKESEGRRKGMVQKRRQPILWVEIEDLITGIQPPSLHRNSQSNEIILIF